MSYKCFDSCSWWVGFALCFAFSFVAFGCVWPCVSSVSCQGMGVSFGGVFCFDYASLCLSLLSILIVVSLAFWVLEVKHFVRVSIAASLFFSLLCYSCVHAAWFWVFYEMSIIPLLILLSFDSPYSERFVALWYFSGYVVLGSLPMLLCILYFSEVFGSYDIRLWGSKLDDNLFILVGVILGLLFVTKIPLAPFHVWLPIVHAEASSPVSICLSGYIMKLGVLGVYRFCSDILSAYVFNTSYVAICLVFSICFFLCALRELDAKRWLAFFSLGHISIAVSCLSFGGWYLHALSFVYCLGHGLSAAAMFVLIWLVFNVASTRNIILMKHVLWSSLFLRVLFCLVFGTICCVPPTLQFFSELFLVVEALWLSNHVLTILLYSYVFFSGLSPILFLGVLLTRHYDVSLFLEGFLVPLSSLCFLVFWSFALFFVC